MKSKKIIFIVIVCCMLLVFCGCNFTDEPLSLESNELTTASMFGGSSVDAETYNSLITEFESQNRIKIKDISSSSSETWKKTILRQFETGSEPDVVFFFNDATAKPLIESKKVVSLEEIRAEYPTFASNIDERYLTGGYSVPIRTFAEGLFYNKDLFKDLGEEVPKTYADLLNVIAKINEKNEGLQEPSQKIAISLGASDSPHYMLESLLLMELGGEEYAKYPYIDNKDMEQAVPLYEKAFEKLAELESVNAFGKKKSTAKSYDAAKNEFLSGNSYMFVDGSWLYPNSENHISLDKIGVAPFPVKELIEEIVIEEGTEYIKSNYGENVIAGCSSGYFISRRAWEDRSKREKAVKFVQFMTKDENILRFGSMTTIKDDYGLNNNQIQISFKEIVKNSLNQYSPIDDRDYNFTFNYLVDSAMDIIENVKQGEEYKIPEEVRKNIDKFIKEV